MGSVSTQVILFFLVYSCVDCSKVKFGLLKKSLLTSFPYVSLLTRVGKGVVCFYH